MVLSLLVSLAAITLVSPARSAISYQTVRQILREFIQVVLVFLGVVTPPTPLTMEPTQPTSALAPMIQRAVAPKPVVHDVNSMVLRREPSVRRYTYLFDGTAVYRHQPAVNASVLVRLSSGDTTVTKGTFTNEDGSYSLEISIDAVHKAPVDWEMEAYTPDFKKVELTGRRIAEREEDSTPDIVTNNVEFVASLPK